MIASKTVIKTSELFPSVGIRCTRCNGIVTNYEPGSFAYQKEYGHPLPAICDSCLLGIMNSVKSAPRA